VLLLTNTVQLNIVLEAIVDIYIKVRIASVLMYIYMKVERIMETVFIYLLRKHTLILGGENHSGLICINELDN
jgi:hypothetical protein